MYPGSQSLFYFLLHRETCRTFVPWPGIEPVPPAVGAQSLNYQTTEEVPGVFYFPQES